MYVTAIVLAAGRGLRFGSKTPKPLVKINSRPIIIYCLQALSKHRYIRDIIVVVNPENSKGIISKIRKYRIAKVSRIVKGGRRRQDSVYHGLKAVDSRAELVLIHDVARPFIDKETISKAIREAKRSGAAIAGVPVKATVKEITRSLPRLRSPRCRARIGAPRREAGQARRQVTSKIVVEKTLNRENLYEIQTPQVFKKSLILKAYNKFGNIDVTDDAALVEKLGAKVSVVMGSYDNIKITTPEDLLIAQAIARRM